MSKRNLFLEDGTPRYVRVYDNSGTENATLDCITVVFTKKRVDGQFMDVGASKSGYGIYCRGFSDFLIDKPSYKHLGKKIKFQDLTSELQKLILSDYESVWNK